MTRIISGDLRGREIKVPSSVTRPTASRVREAIFSAVQHALAGFEDLRVLDLYAGSGACAIESISRGASDAVAIEKDSRAAEVIRANATSLKIDNLRVVAMDVSVALHDQPQFGKFDLVFIDPPYALGDQVITGELELLTNGWLEDGAVVVVERDKNSKFEIPNSYTEIRRKVYGDTSVWYGQYEQNEN
ncbi:MAG: rRNA ((966)-N(2))-methyltransferase RsmD [Actinomycetota bacterium]|jgi:16S rRNA (guanine966-N2)-methyltransferase